MMEFENLITLIRTVSDSSLTDLTYKQGNEKLVLSKRQGTVQVISQAGGGELPAAVQAGSSETEKKAEEGHLVISPLVGVFYAAPAEDAAPFVSVGDHVAKGQTLAIVEAMKLMNDIECDVDGTVAEILVENGQAVEYGQPLFRIR